MSYLDKLTFILRNFPECADIINSQSNYEFKIFGKPHLVYVDLNYSVPLTYIEMDNFTHFLEELTCVYSANDISVLEYVAKIILSDRTTYNNKRLYDTVSELLKQKLFNELDDNNPFAFLKNSKYLTKDEYIIKDILT